MKTKLSFMMMPVLLLLLVSIGSIFQVVVNEEGNTVDPLDITGQWTAYEYYDNNINPKGQLSDLDYSKVNQIAKLIKFQSKETPCPEKESKVEQKMEFFKINFKPNGKAEIFEKQYYKANSFDSHCRNTVYDESYNQRMQVNWRIDQPEAALILNDSTKRHLTVFKVLYFGNNELHLSLKQDEDYILVKLHKD